MDLYSQFESFLVRSCTQYPPGLIEMGGLVAGQVAGFLPATMYLLIDILFPDFSRRHEIQNPERQPTWVEIRHCMLFTLFNYAWPLAFYFLFVYWTEFQQATFIMDPKLPSLKNIAFNFVSGLLTRGISSYYVHRALHHPSIYAHIHSSIISIFPSMD